MMRGILAHGRVAIFILVACGLTGGCAAKPKDLLHTAQEAVADARKAREGKDPKAASKAASRARKAADQLKELARKGKLAGPEGETMIAEADAAARLARQQARLAEEEKKRDDHLGSIKAKVYRKGRALVLTYGFSLLADAAGKAASSDVQTLSATEQKAANTAWTLASWLCGRRPLPDGRPDWMGASSDLRTWSQTPPRHLEMILAIGFGLLGFPDLALLETESMDTAGFPSPEEKALYHLFRAGGYILQGWDGLAEAEIDEVTRIFPGGWGGITSPKILGALHLLKAYQALEEKDLIALDAEIALALQSWPDNPVCTFLTGEKMAANGQWEKAAGSIEEIAAGTKEEWLARLLAKRARELREGKGSPKSLVIDSGFSLELILGAVISTANESSLVRDLRLRIEACRDLVDRLSARLPGVGEKP